MNSLTYSKPVYTLANIVDDLFGGNDYCNFGKEITSNSWPKVDIVENEVDYKIYADLPGLEKKDLKISVENDTLSISGEKRRNKKEKKAERYYYYERSYGSFSRSFALPENIDEKNINAHFKNGLLELTLIKKEKAKPKAIEVNVD